MYVKESDLSTKQQQQQQQQRLDLFNRRGESRCQGAIKGLEACKLAILSVINQPGRPSSLTKSTLRNQNWGRVGRVCGGYRCEMFPWGEGDRKEREP